MRWFRCRACGMDYGLANDDDTYPRCPACGAEIDDTACDAMTNGEGWEAN